MHRNCFGALADYGLDADWARFGLRCFAEARAAAENEAVRRRVDQASLGVYRAALEPLFQARAPLTPELRRELDAFTAEDERIAGQLREIDRRARDLADRHRAAAGLLAGLPCRFCGALVRPKISGGRYMSYAWQHTKADEQGCEPLRLAAARERWDALSEEDRHRQGGLFERWALMWHGMDPPGPVEDQEENQ